MQVGVEGRCITIFIAHKREERIDVFGLVVRPKGRVIRFPTRAVHRSSLGFVNAFTSTDFGEGEHTVDDWIWSFQHQFVHQLVYQCFSFLLFFRAIQLDTFLIGRIGADGCGEMQGIVRLEGEVSRLINSCFDAEGTRNPLLRIGETLLVYLRQFDGQACLARVDEAITFHQSRVFGRREIFADKLPLSPSSEVVLAFYFQDSFQADSFHLFVGESPSVHGNHVEYIPSIPAHEACVGVVRDGA